MTTETEVPMVAEIDCSTNSLTYRPMTDAEIKAQKEAANNYAQELEARENARAATEALKESAKAKLVAGEPLTEEEAAQLVI